MPSPANAIQKAVYDRLTGYPALNSLVGNRVYDFVPASAQSPYVVIGDDTGVDWSTSTENGWQATLTIHCWDFERAGRKSVKAIMSAIYDALHRQESSITVSGFALVLLQSEFETTLHDTTPTGPSDRYYHGVQRFRALIETTT